MHISVSIVFFPCMTTLAKHPPDQRRHMLYSDSTPQKSSLTAKGWSCLRRGETLLTWVQVQYRCFPTLWGNRLTPSWQARFPPQDVWSCFDMCPHDTCRGTVDPEGTTSSTSVKGKRSKHPAVIWLFPHGFPMQVLLIQHILHEASQLFLGTWPLYFLFWRDHIQWPSPGPASPLRIFRLSQYHVQLDTSSQDSSSWSLPFPPPCLLPPQPHHLPSFGSSLFSLRFLQHQHWVGGLPVFCIESLLATQGLLFF